MKRRKRIVKLLHCYDRKKNNLTTQQCNNYKSPQGFTLIELLIVIAIVGILASVTVIAINPVKKINQAKDAKIKTDISQIANAMQKFYTSFALSGETPYYPSAVSALVQSELRNEPKDAGGVAYPMEVPNVGGVPCTTVLRNCPDVAVYHVIDAPNTPNFVSGTAVWCWSSATNQAKEVANARRCNPLGELSGLDMTSSANYVRTTNSPVYPTNMLTYSEEFDNTGAWAREGMGFTINRDAAIAPDGTRTAEEIVFPAVASGRDSILRQSVSRGSATRIASIWVRFVSGDTTGLQFGILDSTGRGEIQIRPTVQWQRFATGSSTGTLQGVRIRYEGPNSGATIEVWGAQLEEEVQ